MIRRLQVPALRDHETFHAMNNIAHQLNDIRGHLRRAEQKPDPLAIIELISAIELLARHVEELETRPQQIVHVHDSDHLT